MANKEQAAQQAYEQDLKRCPKYHDGTPRRTWEQLCPIAKLSWERNPTPRAYKQVTHG